MVTKLCDEYEVALEKGQSVAVAISESIVLKGQVADINVPRKEVEVLVTWPVGVSETRLVRHYGRRGDNICMSQLVVI